MKRGKRYKEAAKLVDPHAIYEPEEALGLVVQSATAKFDETIEIHLKMGVDSRRADQQIRGTVILPHGTGKTMRVAVFAKGAAAEEAKEAGADFVGSEELADKIQKEGWLDFDVAIATPDLMGGAGRLVKVLGPRGLMPNPKSGTVTTDVGRAVTEAKAGRIEYRLEKQNIIHCAIGKASFGPEKLLDNYDALPDAVIRARPSAAKGQYIQRCTLTSTLGPGARTNPKLPK